MGFADALSRAQVKFLAASPETMLAPGVPSDVAEAIAAHEGDSKGMAQAVVSDVMRTRYAAGPSAYGPAAAFDVLDLDAAKISRAESAHQALQRRRRRGAQDAGRARRAARGYRRDRRHGTLSLGDADMPWRADRPAIAVYDAIASDGRLDEPCDATRERRAAPFAT